MLRLVGGVNRAAAANKKPASGGVTQASAPRNHPVEDDWRDVGKSVGSVNDLREASTLAALRVDRATVAARGHQIETESAPIRYVAELLGADTDSERAIRWLILLMVLCCDPLAIALTAPASARNCGLTVTHERERLNRKRGSAAKVIP